MIVLKDSTGATTILGTNAERTIRGALEYMGWNNPHDKEKSEACRVLELLGHRKSAKAIRAQFLIK